MGENPAANGRDISSHGSDHCCNPISFDNVILGSKPGSVKSIELRGVTRDFIPTPVLGSSRRRNGQLNDFAI
jgi:hypothetical protein